MKSLSESCLDPICEVNLAVAEEDAAEVLVRDHPHTIVQFRSEQHLQVCDPLSQLGCVRGRVDEHYEEAEPLELMRHCPFAGEHEVSHQLVGVGGPRALLGSREDVGHE